MTEHGNRTDRLPATPLAMLDEVLLTLASWSDHGPMRVTEARIDLLLLRVAAVQRAHSPTRPVQPEGEAPMDALTQSDREAGAVAVAPRVTLDDVNAKVDREQYHVFDEVLTICVLTTTSGFTVTGESACASPENFDEELGRKFAREQAIRKLWGFEGYVLRELLAAVPARSCGPQPGADGRNYDIGLAMLAARAGKRVAREGWNGAGMFVYHVPANRYPVQTGAAKAHFGEGSLVPYREYLAMKTVQGDVATWAPSTSDALASDWFVLPEGEGR